MIIDCCTFFNELDLLEIRIKTLAPKGVDLFLVAEGDTTFQGQPKPFHLEENWGRFASLESKDKILRVPVKMRGRTHGWSPWERESLARRALCNWLLVHVGVKKDDIILLSDVDEIPDLCGPVMHEKRSWLEIMATEREPVVWIHDMTYYWLDLWVAKWRGTIAMKWEYIYSQVGCDFQRLRNMRGARAYLVNPGGWHLAYLGGAKNIVEKVKAFSHTELKEWATEENISKQMARGADPFHRTIYEFRETTDEEHARLPAYLLENENKFGYMWRPR